ncbi:MAG: YibE/F family protein [Candidatus Doudnabacteria bacterium]|nr:YibE/F family protein [Candidatus Doudnabacteria bacterium]
MFKKPTIILLNLVLVVGLLLPFALKAQEEPLEAGHIPAEEFYRAEVLEVLRNEEEQLPDGAIYRSQTYRVKLLSGPESGKEVEIPDNGVMTLNGGEGLSKGEKVIVYKVSSEVLSEYYIADTYRLPSLILIVIFFFLVAVAFARWKGLTSILGLGVTVLVIAKFVVPQIIAGKNPVLISLIAALIIALVSIYLSHGFNKRTSIALVSTLITLGLASILSFAFVSFGKLFGLGSEQAFYLQLGDFPRLNLQGLLLGGIILGVLGVLDDITTSQSAAVEEIRRAGSQLTLKQLYQRGTSVGREHIASLVNTLFLAYAGASLPMFLFFQADRGQPLWVILNAEFIAEEIIRTLVGSTALILAVPITTFLASYFFSRKNNPQTYEPR